MIIVDTSVWIDFFGGRSTLYTEWLRSRFGLERFGMTDLIFCEVLQGIREEADVSRVLAQTRGFQVLESGGRLLALRSAENYRFLRSKGVTVRTTIDCLIATVCLEHGHTLLHRDRDFDAFERYLGLKVVRPRAM